MLFAAKTKKTKFLLFSILCLVTLGMIHQMREVGKASSVLNDFLSSLLTSISPFTTDDENQDDLDFVFSACVMIRDENHRLPEWLAYHAYMLHPLKYVVFVVDPRSATSPMAIVNRWNQNSNIRIEVWNASQVDIATKLSANQRESIELQTKQHRTLQPRFFNQCANYLRQQAFQDQQKKTSTENQTAKTKIPPLYIAFHDLDEYINLDAEVVPDAKERMSKPGSIGTFLRDINLLQLRQVKLSVPLSVPQQQRLAKLYNETANKYDQQTYQKLMKFASWSFETRCFPIPRNQFGNVEAHDPAIRRQIQQRAVPNYLLPYNYSLETLRFLHRSQHWQEETWNRAHKSMILFGSRGISTLVNQDYNNTKNNLPLFLSSKENRELSSHVHFRMKNCPEKGLDRHPIRLRHYQGSWPAYSSRLDNRLGTNHRSRETFLFRSEIGKTNPPDDTVRPWLWGFCALMNHNVTRITALLHGAGQLSPIIPDAIRQSRWNLEPQLIVSQAMETPDNNTNNEFGEWLRQRFEITEYDLSSPNKKVSLPSHKNYTTYISGDKQYIIQLQNPDMIDETYPYIFPTAWSSNM